jgi:CHAD domain-containing protein
MTMKVLPPPPVTGPPVFRPNPALAGSWERERQRHKRLLRQCRRQPSGRNIHDLRIATRRLLAYLGLLRTVSSLRVLLRSQKKLKKLLRLTAPARDTRVQLRLLGRLARDQQHPGLRKIRRQLKARTRRLARELPAELKRCQPTVRRIPPDRFASMPPITPGPLLRLKFNRLRERLRAARTGETSALHRARLTLKQLRYLVEIILPPSPGQALKPLEQLTAIQSALGELHDFDLLLRRLETYARRHKPLAAWLRPRHAALRRRRQALRRARPQLAMELAALLPPDRPPAAKTPHEDKIP